MNFQYENARLAQGRGHHALELVVEQVHRIDLAFFKAVDNAVGNRLGIFELHVAEFVGVRASDLHFALTEVVDALLANQLEGQLRVFVIQGEAVRQLDQVGVEATR